MQMKPLIPAKNYLDHEVFEQEQITFFQNLWTFAGFTIDLEHHNDFICKRVGGQSILVQNFDGELHAFRNVCTHRFSQIHREPQGNGPLRCPYHGWAFDKEGIPVGIPDQSDFDSMDRAAKEALKLEEWAVDRCGPLVFVRRSQEGPSLREFMGEFYDEVAHFAQALGPRLDRYEMIFNANWKVVVENTLESYHVRHVHPNSLGPYGMGPEYFRLYDSHSIYGSEQGELDDRLRKLQFIFNHRKLVIDGYQHYFVFPALTLATLSGVILSVHSMNPISPTETQAINYTFMGKLKEDRLEEAVVRMGGSSMAEFTRTVWNEDRPICEQVQMGLASVDRERGIFANQEQRVHLFHKAYTQMMGVAS